MNKPPWTPGPWFDSPTYRREDKDLDWATPINSGKVCVIYAIQAQSRGKLEAEANARLIAAAPELVEELAAAIELLEWCGPQSPYSGQEWQALLKPAKAALAKARGEVIP